MSGLIPLWIGLALLAAYANSFRVPFLFDDVPSIVENPSLREFSFRSLLGVGQAGGLTTSGRPVLAWTLALNRMMGGESVAVYHVTNGLIHLAASLVLFGIVRRTLSGALLAERFGGVAIPLSGVIAGLWALHPLQTESVTYIVQRAESLAGLFYLLVIYMFIRGTGSSRPWRWWSGSLVACLLGVGSKEIVATAPVLVWLYDRTFVSGSFRAAWQRHRSLHLALSSTWIVFLGLWLATSGRGGTAGFNTEMTSWSYALTQCRALVRYLTLSAWPSSLTFDYGIATVRHLADVLPAAIAVLMTLIGVVMALKRWPAAGFLGAAFFVLLAPSSSFVPIVTQTMAEHRMYLALAMPLALLIVLLFRAIGRAGLVMTAAAGLAMGISTWARNRDYGSEVVIWRDTVQKCPLNARAHNNWGRELFRQGDTEHSIASYRRALELQPRYPETHYNLAVALASKGEWNAAVEHYSTALQWEPEYVEAHNNLGNALVALGRITEAITHYERALATRPDFAEAHNNLGNALLQLGRPAAAQEEIRKALELRANYPEAHFNLGNGFAAAGDMRAARSEYQRALQMKPDYVEALVNFGNACLALDDREEALSSYKMAVDLRPSFVDARFNLASLLLDSERWGEASEHLAIVLRSNPRHAPAHRALAYTFAKLGRREAALMHYESYLFLVPDDAEARKEADALRGVPARP